MVFKREKRVKGHTYHYLLENYRQDGRVRQRILQYWGRAGESPVTKAYRENIGPVPPMMAEELAKAERQWPEEQILTAIREAVVNRKLNWAYILKILRRYKEEGFTPPYRERQEHRPSGRPREARPVQPRRHPITYISGSDGRPHEDPMAATRAASWTTDIGDEDDETAAKKPAARQSITLAEWFKLWSEDYLKDATVGAQSFYRETFVNHILPELGAIPLQEITRSHVRQLLDKVPTGQYPGRRPIRSALQECLVGAINKGLLATNPASRFEYVDSVCKWCGREFRAQKRYDGIPPSDHCNRSECVDKDREEWQRASAQIPAASRLESLGLVVIINGRTKKAASFDQLTAKEQRVLELRFGLKDGKHSTREIANELHVCGQRVRELEVHALDKLYGDRLSLKERRQRFAEEGLSNVDRRD